MGSSGHKSKPNNMNPVYVPPPRQQSWGWVLETQYGDSWGELMAALADSGV